jgi:apolipoprotein N-acyltransferase
MATVPDYIGVCTNLGLAAAQLIALTTAFLTALFAVRQVNVVIESKAYKRVGWFLLFCFITVFLWILVSFLEVLGFISRAEPNGIQKTAAILELLATTLYLCFLLIAAADLYRYIKEVSK